MGFGEAAFGIAATIGKVDAFITLIVAIGFGLLCLCAGLVLVFNRNVSQGILFVLVGLIVAFLGCLYFFFISNNETAAAVVGTIAVADMVINGGDGNKGRRKKTKK